MRFSIEQNSQLERYLNGLEELASGSFRSEVHPAIAQEVEQLMEQEFEASRDPYGAPWAPKKRPNGMPTLIATGAMQRSIAANPSREGATVQLADPKAKFHQFGTRKMPARPMLPADNRMPAHWESQLATAASNVFKRVLKRALG